MSRLRTDKQTDWHWKVGQYSALTESAKGAQESSCNRLWVLWMYLTKISFRAYYQTNVCISKKVFGAPLWDMDEPNQSPLSCPNLHVICTKLETDNKALNREELVKFGKILLMKKKFFFWNSIIQDSGKYNVKAIKTMTRNTVGSWWQS